MKGFILVGKATHFKVEHGRTACGIVGALYASTDPKECDCLHCRRTTKYKRAMGIGPFRSMPRIQQLKGRVMDYQDMATEAKDHGAVYHMTELYPMKKENDRDSVFAIRFFTKNDYEVGYWNPVIRMGLMFDQPRLWSKKDKTKLINRERI